MCQLKQENEQSVWDIYVFWLKFEYGNINFQYYKSFQKKIWKCK